MTGRQTSTRPGWTLIELVVVLALLGILSGGALLTMKSPLATAQRNSQREAVLLLDRLARSQARESRGIVKLEFVWGDAPGCQLVRAAVQPVLQRALPALRGVRLAGAIRQDRRVVVPFTANGQSPSYAVRFGAGDREEWVLIVGGSGQPLGDCDDQQVDALLRSETAHAQ